MRNLIIAAAILLLLGTGTAGAQTCPAPTADELLANAMMEIGELGLNSGNTQSLLGPLSNALTDLASGDTEGALQQLDVLVNKIDAQTGKALTEAQAAQLLALIEGIIDELTPPSCVCTDLFPEWSALLDSPDLTPVSCFNIAYDPGEDRLEVRFVGDPAGSTFFRAANAPSFIFPSVNCSLTSPGLGYLEFPLTGEEAAECVEFVNWYANQAGITCLGYPSI